MASRPGSTAEKYEILDRLLQRGMAADPGPGVPDLEDLARALAELKARYPDSAEELAAFFGPLLPQGQPEPPALPALGSPVDEVAWARPGPLAERESPAVSDSGGSAVLFRLALSAAALLVIFVLAREVWRPRPEARSPAVVTPPPPRAPSPPLPVEAVAPRLEPTLVEEPAVAPSEPAAPAETPSEPRVIAAAPPPAVHAEPERRPAAPAPRPLPPPWEEGPQPAGLLRPGPGVEEPVPLELPRYRYPPEAQGTGLRADVRLALLVDERGRVIAARVREGAPLGLGFAETALSVAERIPFQPATRHRVPGKMWTELILEFIE